MKSNMIFLFFLFTFALCGADFGKILKTNQNNLWTLDQEQCRKIFAVPLRSENKSNSVLRYNRTESRVSLPFCGKNISEMLLEFEDDKLQSISVSLYNRGDDGPINEKVFEQLYRKLAYFCAAATACRKPVNETRKLEDFKVQSLKYSSTSGDFVIRRNLKGPQAEYLQLMICPQGKAKDLRSSLKTSSDKKLLQLNIKHSDKGDVFIDIPMVNQGDKGYCAASTIERIMKYYGSSVDQQIIAQIAQSDTKKRTNLDTVIKVLHRLEPKLGVHIENIIDESKFTAKDLKNRLEDYNNIAKKQKKERIDIKNFFSGRRMLSPFEKIIGSLDYGIYRDTRCCDTRNSNKFTAEIQNSIDKGIPLVWAIYSFQNMTDGKKIGKVNGHMRIINGYNKKTNQIIYTDSWGKGHEIKYMDVKDAWTINIMLMQIRPK